MIEAVNSVLSNAAYTKTAIEQQSVAQSYAANPDRIQVAPQAPYISPYVHMDINFDKAVLQLRDSETGDVVRQIPTEGQLEAYKRAQAASTDAKKSAPKKELIAETSGSTSSTVSAPVSDAPLPSIQSSDASFAPKAGSIVSAPVDTSV
jgi:hypothetical protein